MTECRVCGKPLRAFKNDWATRKYHKVCWAAQREKDAEISRLKNQVYLLMLSRTGQSSVK